MASARFLADITGPKGDKGEGVGNSLRIRPLSELPSLNVADWIGNDLIGIYPVANSSTALTIVGRPLGSDVAAFVALEPLASGGSLVKWVEYTGARRSFEKVISTTSANRTEWKRTDVTTRTVLHQLSMPGNNALVDTEPTRHVRLPLKMFAAVDSWELVFKNFNDISSTNRGAVDFVDVYIAKRASDGNGGYTQNFAEEPTKLGTPVRYSVGATSERYVITDIHFQLEANVEYLISYAYTTPGGTPNHMGIGGSYLGTLPIGVASMSVSNTWSPYTPLDVYIKLQAAPETPFYIYPGSSSETGLNTEYPLRDCWGWRHAEANGAIPALLGQSGTSLESWVGGSNYIRSKLSTIARADKVVGMPGSNDIYGGATLSQMQARLTAFALYVRRYMGQSFEVADVFPRRTETAGVKAVRQGFNDYLRTLPEGALVCHSRASAVEAEDGLMRPDFDSGDGVHLNTFGQHMLAAHIITGGGSGSGLPGPAGPTGAGVPAGGTAGQFIRKNSSGTTTEWVSPTAAVVGLGNVDNTTDAGKPLSTAAVNALAGKASTTDVALKADKTELATKADASALADKANVSDLALKADASALTPLLPKTEAASTYATKTEVTTELEARVQPIVPPLVSQAIANDPTIVSSAANMAQSTVGLVPVWKANTGYTAGQRVIAPNGDVVSAKVAFTSAAAYSATNWNASTQDARVGALEANKFLQAPITTLAEADALKGAAFAGKRYPVNNTSVFGAYGNVDVYYNGMDGRTKHIFIPSAPGIFQTKYRNYSGGAWSEMLPVPNAALLASGVDFRTLTYPTTWSIQFTNHPNQASATPGTLEVLPASGGVTHRFTESRSPQKVFTCSLNGSTWSDWETPQTGGGTQPPVNGFSIPVRGALDTAIVSVTSKPAKEIMVALSRDRVRGWNSSTSDFSETLDDGKTWTPIKDKNGANVFAGATVESVLPLANGEILVSCLRGGINRREMWLSENIATESTRSFSRVLLGRAEYVKYTSAWSQSEHGSMIFVNEYGPKTPTWTGQPVAAGDNARYAYMSLDGGKNLNIIFDLNEYLINTLGRPNTDNQHLHGIAWDPYWDRVWITFGDNSGGNGSNGIVYSDNLGESWKTAQTYSGTTPPYQCVGIQPMPKCVLFYTDNVPVGSPDVVRLDRAEGKHKVGTYTPVSAFESTASGKHLCQGFTRQDRPGDDGVAMAAFSSEGEAAPSFAVATLDGFTFKEIWRDTVDNPSGFGSRSIVGPTLRGKTIISSNDQKVAGMFTEVVLEATGY
ncbi:hypothetical protein [Pseudarthrobacter sp. PS3-L1]|uniref:hypothetical protein n=1 Tax=Pseudarthrobacter sp. PS3-L1 TaxID=3046207 RepID=UPI0024BB71D1|nr:hypothetical protein [Pseudarthrobacter sp. PS3-L1]MDJ0321649.1 hypothetical protein [Pseudarthrobacter sp. PS3-L1]